MSTMPGCYNQESLGLSQLRVQLWENDQPAMAWVHEAEESPLLEAIARERLIKTQQAGKSLECAVVICEL
jgi:hypothetical protein